MFQNSEYKMNQFGLKPPAGSQNFSLLASKEKAVGLVQDFNYFIAQIILIIHKKPILNKMSE
jgi:hypothetical protein